MEARDARSAPLNAQDSPPQQRITQLQMSLVLKLGDPGLEGFATTSQQLLPPCLPFRGVGEGEGRW